MPESYVNRPKIYSHLAYIMTAFSELDSDRAYMDIVRMKAHGADIIEQKVRIPLPIPFKSIAEYAKIYKYEDEEFDDFLYLLRKVDYYYIQMYSVSE